MMIFSDEATPHILEDFKSFKFYNKIISEKNGIYYLIIVLI